MGMPRISSAARWVGIVGIVGIVGSDPTIAPAAFGEGTTRFAEGGQGQHARIQYIREILLGRFYFEALSAGDVLDSVPGEMR
jgi:hypothetical protein